MERDVQSVWKLFGRNESKFDLTLAMLGGDNGISMANLAVHIDLLVQMVPCDHDPRGILSSAKTEEFQLVTDTE